MIILIGIGLVIIGITAAVSIFRRPPPGGPFATRGQSPL